MTDHASSMGGLSAPRERRRKLLGRLFAVLCGAATAVGVLSLVVLLGDLALDGLPRLSIDFLNSFASRFPERAGVKAALAGSVWILARFREAYQ